MDAADIDFSTPTWHQLRRWAEAELERARRRNDSADLDAIATARLRGEIAQLKRLLALPQEAARSVGVAPD